MICIVNILLAWCVQQDNFFFANIVRMCAQMSASHPVLLRAQKLCADHADVHCNSHLLDLAREQFDCVSEHIDAQLKAALQEWVQTGYEFENESDSLANGDEMDD